MVQAVAVLLVALLKTFDRTAKIPDRLNALRGYTKHYPTDGVSTLSWWWGLSASATLRAMPAVA
jgi:hypothetical protein